MLPPINGVFGEDVSTFEIFLYVVMVYAIIGVAALMMLGVYMLLA